MSHSTNICDHNSLDSEFMSLYEQQLGAYMLIAGGLRKMTCLANVYVLESLIINI